MFFGEHGESRRARGGRHWDQVVNECEVQLEIALQRHNEPRFSDEKFVREVVVRAVSALRPTRRLSDAEAELAFPRLEVHRYTEPRVRIVARTYVPDKLTADVRAIFHARLFEDGYEMETVETAFIDSP